MAKSIRDKISLDGMWKGLLESWSEPGSTIEKVIVLPGTLDEHGLGPKPDSASDRLSRAYAYEGVASYERSVDIPESWRGKSIFFRMERTRETELRVDGILVGSSNSLSTSQVYDVSRYLDPGKHLITVMVDNRSGIMAWNSIRNSHMATDHTQTNWNGIVGAIELYAVDPVHIEHVRVHAQSAGTVHGKALLRKPAGSCAVGRILIQMKDLNSMAIVETKEIPFSMYSEIVEAEINFTIEADETLRLWDEFDPAMYSFHLTLDGIMGEHRFADEQIVPLGIRNFIAGGTQFEVNGKKTLLRGKHDACVFPLTGYAPMDVDSWLDVFRTAKAYGINHYRFHSWCPPEAAFEAADRIGIYLQPELPLWNPGTAFEDDEEWQYFSDEAFRILKAYGNHPSFVMFAWGNELAGSIERMELLVEEARKYDPSKLYAIGSNNFFIHARAPRNSDYWTTFWTEGNWNVKKSGYGGKHVRGATPHSTRGFINNNPPSSRKDYQEEIKDIPFPIIGHEVGQFQIHPSFNEINKYKGVLEPELLTRFRAHAAASGLLSQADDFQAASGRLACLCYREEIEAVLRTPGMAGFQLLDLQDFPGQGGAFVGILDSFMDSKGIIEPEEWRRFCSEVVPLVRIKRYVWSEGERIDAQIEVANYGPSSLEDRAVTWSIMNENGRQVAEGSFPNVVISQGDVGLVGTLEFEIPPIAEPERWKLWIKIEQTTYCNEYALWVYPSRGEVSIPSAVFISDAFDTWTQEALHEGKNVLLLPSAHRSFGHGPQGTFIPDFWCYPMFKKYDPPGTLGILCDPAHPALSDFPTSSHAEWQWWHLMKNSRAMVLDEAGADYRPIVQVIDNVARQQKLGILFEAKVGKGKLMICSIDLWSQQDRPEAQQLLHSLLNYCKSDKFVPEAIWTEEYVEKIFANQMMSEVISNPNADTYG
ncbi:sugar-binding domain-containing protein [Paenibacillus sinopodophylli]|uniref:sugar-binding domain-containing protein n=1 Tax=Paenibacillus sinopodophylli TaxID=1837342 RepID=UPI001486E56D|nr:sugar-binding domain-containing protein [Paenibacillus sinopodophylli]